MKSSARFALVRSSDADRATAEPLPFKRSRVSATAPLSAQGSLDSTIISRDTARMLKTLLGNLDGMVYRCRDDHNWTMEFISEGCRRLTGYQPDDLLHTLAQVLSAQPQECRTETHV